MEKSVKLGLAYLFPIVGSLVVLFVVKDHDQEERNQIGQALVLNIAMIIFAFALSLFGAIPFVGFTFRFINRIISVLPIILGILYFMGKTYEFPVLYDLGTSLVSSIK